MSTEWRFIKKLNFCPESMGLWIKCWSSKDLSKQTTESFSIKFSLWIVLCEQHRYYDKYVIEAKCLFYTHDKMLPGSSYAVVQVRDNEE